MVEGVLIFLMGLVCGIAACHLRLRGMKKKVRLYESYIERRLGEVVPSVGERMAGQRAEQPHTQELFPVAEQRRRT